MASIIPYYRRHFIIFLECTLFIILTIKDPVKRVIISDACRFLVMLIHHRVSVRNVTCRQASAELCLRFSTNSCRRARWDARLGYHCSPAPPAARLAALLPDGGPVARLDALVARVYPLLYYSRQDGAGGQCQTASTERHLRATL